MKLLGLIRTNFWCKFLVPITHANQGPKLLKLYYLYFNKFCVLFQDLRGHLEKLSTTEEDLLFCTSAQESREQNSTVLP